MPSKVASKSADKTFFILRRNIPYFCTVSTVQKLQVALSLAQAKGGYEPSWLIKSEPSLVEPGLSPKMPTRAMSSRARIPQNGQTKEISSSWKGNLILIAVSHYLLTTSVLFNNKN